MIYYPVNFIVDRKKYIFLWFENEDGINRFLKEYDAIVIFTDENSFEYYCYINTLRVSTNIFELDIDTISSNTVDCCLLLDFWNCVSDLAFSADTLFLGDSDDDSITYIYNKLFVNSEVSIITKNYKNSRFSKKDLKTLNEVIASGINNVINIIKIMEL